MLLRFTSIALTTLVLSQTPLKAACTPQREEQLMTQVLHNEAVANRRAQAKVAATVFVRRTVWGYGDLCSVMTAPNQYVHRVKRHYPAKWAMARTNAAIFLREYHARNQVTEGDIFARFSQQNIDSFHAARAQVRGGEDNVFYNAKQRRKRHRH